MVNLEHLTMDQLHQINVEYEGLEKTGELAEDSLLYRETEATGISPSVFLITAGAVAHSACRRLLYG